MFQCYGYVEDYPHLYVIDDWDDDEYRLKFEADRNGESGKVEVSFLVPLSEGAVDFMKEEVAELEGLKGALSIKQPLSIPEWEWDAALALHDAYLTDLKAALEASKDVVLTDAVMDMGPSWYLSNWKRWVGTSGYH
jgi:hypothetical protein